MTRIIIDLDDRILTERVVEFLLTLNVGWSVEAGCEPRRKTVRPDRDIDVAWAEPDFARRSAQRASYQNQYWSDVLLNPCSTCGALVGEPCTQGSGHVAQKPHTHRINK